MSHLIRSPGARLVGQPRHALQEIHGGTLATFDGMVDSTSCCAFPR
jgi:hypothetical protein